RIPFLTDSGRRAKRAHPLSARSRLSMESGVMIKESGVGMQRSQSAIEAGAREIGNPRFQNALSRIPQATPPIWLMRQAGRYHRHYQDLRRQFSFMDLCKQPELAAHVALGPVMDFDFDAAILFSDLLF